MPDIFDEVGTPPAPSPENGQAPGPAQGDIFDQVATAPPASAAPTTPAGVPDSLDTNNPNHSWLGNQAREINSLGAGIGSGVMDTIGGGINLARKLDEKFGINPAITNVEQKAANYVQGKNQELTQQNSENPGIHSLGKGVETLAEFLIPGEGEVNAAGKAMSYAERLTEGTKIAKILEDRPVLQRIMRAGVRAIGTGTEQAAIQGGQTLVKSGGDVGQAAQSAGVAGAVGGALGGAGSLIGDALTGAGKAGQSVQKLEDVADQATPKGEVSKNLADTINTNQADLKSNYGETLRDFQDRTAGTTVPYADSPLHKTVQDLLGKGKAESTPFDAALDKSRPGSEGVNATLQELNDLGTPPEPKVEKWVDNQGVEHTENVAGEQPQPINLDMKTLLDQRRLIGERLRGVTGYDSESLADKKVYGSLLGGIDDTIDKLVNEAKDPDVAAEYEHLRDNYKEHIDAFNDPVIKKITNPDGAPDDAAKAFVGLINRSGAPSGGTVQRSLNTLQKVLDPMGTQGDKPLKEFGNQVFQSMLKDAKPENGNFNASRFMETWNRIDPATKDRLFDVNNPQSTISALSKDANDVKNVQRLVRVGLLTAPALAGGAIGPHVAEIGLGALGLLSVVNEHAGVQTGRNMLDFIANHPATWSALRAGGRLAENPEAQKGAGDAVRVLSHEAGEATTNK